MADEKNKETEARARDEAKAEAQKGERNDEAGGTKHPLDESEVPSLEGTDDEPAADANPDEATVESRSWPNMMDTGPDVETGEPLSAAQKARIEGTPLDGANGAITTHEPTSLASKHEGGLQRAAKADEAARASTAKSTRRGGKRSS